MPDADPQSPLFTTGADIDVSQIMEDIRKRIDQKKKSGVLNDREVREIEEMELQPLPDFLEIPNVYRPHLYPPHQTDEAARKWFTIPDEPEEGLGKKIMGKIRRLLDPLIRFMIRPYIRDAKLLSLKNSNSNLKAIREVEPLIYQSKDYVKLLHNCANNLIVELTKLKIEEETLKTKIKTLEDKVAFLEKRERAIEDRVFD